ncbi:hypothetical protein ElyMa_006299700 [Elysia marginata]|uniref:Uncharacterized protein n=1 Tax=Elysia marginata TaxID=1093978 RepID=A0AAV4HID6_9GAST|nr:hypothetical protein ElyMa_006299700 [Elysia marginata]
MRGPGIIIRPHVISKLRQPVTLPGPRGVAAWQVEWISGIVISLFFSVSLEEILSDSPVYGLLRPPLADQLLYENKQNVQHTFMAFLSPLRTHTHSLIIANTISPVAAPE